MAHPVHGSKFTDATQPVPSLPTHELCLCCRGQYATSHWKSLFTITGRKNKTEKNKQRTIL